MLDIVQKVRERLQTAPEGRLAPQPVLSEVGLHDLTAGTDDSNWSAACALRHGSAHLFRTAATDPSFPRLFQSQTFSQSAFL